MIDNSSIAAILTDPRQPDNPIIRCNEAFIELTGYDRDEIIGRNCRFLAGKGTDPNATQTIRESIARHQPVMTEIINYRKDGTRFRNAVMIVPIFDAEGKLEYFLGSQVAVGGDTLPARRQAARKQIEALTPRQQKILTEMAAGKLNKQIAHELGLSERTIKMHRAAVIAALDVRSSAEAIRIAVEAGY
ncbi:MAG: PAS domain-containing protein [Sphingomonadales bacterium]|nr:MAG: PAS domain-containing protein [Sphingomonadales bacterium]TNF01995.1 MAG: PAS domain-containing protein [Sphingomonadales bacterium]